MDVWVNAIRDVGFVCYTQTYSIGTDTVTEQYDWLITRQIVRMVWDLIQSHSVEAYTVDKIIRRVWGIVFTI